MTALREAERLLPNLTRAEKALLAQRLVSDLETWYRAATATLLIEN